MSPVPSAGNEAISAGEPAPLSLPLVDLCSSDRKVLFFFGDAEPKKPAVVLSARHRSKTRNSAVCSIVLLGITLFRERERGQGDGFLFMVTGHAFS